MQSYLKNHFPHIIHRNGERLLWNPILKKAYKNLPEERVRLQTLEFLLHDVEWPASRISCETAIRPITEDANTVRADMICYDSDFKPSIIIECKAPNIRLTASTAHQIAGYNQKINAPYLFLTNGINDMFVDTGSGEATTTSVSAEQLFGKFNGNACFDTLTYYVERGFAGNKSSPAVMNWLRQALPVFFSRQDGSLTRYLDVGCTPDGEPVSHYYKLYTLDGDKKFAVTFLASRNRETRLIAILNEEGINTGIMEINLELMAKNADENTLMYQADGVRKIGLTGLIDFSTFEEAQLSSVVERLSNKLQQQ